MTFLWKVLEVTTLHSTQLRVILLLDNIRSLHNVGSLFRTADAANIEGIALCGLTPTPPRAEISKTALGATETVSWQYFQNTEDAIDRYRKHGYRIVGLEQSDRSTDLYQTELPQPMVLIIGHERVGVSERSLALCDQIVELPMLGKSARSLNVSVAGALALYELHRRS